MCDTCYLKKKHANNKIVKAQNKNLQYDMVGLEYYFENVFMI